MAEPDGTRGARETSRALPVSGPSERSVDVAGSRVRVWEKGEGPPLGFLGGLRGLPRWPAVLDRLAERRRVVAPSLPGMPGGAPHDGLDGIADWVTATLDLLEGAGLDGADLVGASIGGLLAAEVAAFSRASVGRLALVAPLGLFDAAEPVADLFARRPHELPALLSTQPEALARFFERPAGEDEVEWQLLLTRAAESAARLLWPLGDRGLARRLHRIRAPTLLVWGSDDRVVPPSYAKRFTAAIGGWVELRSIDGAGHLAEIDRPEAVAEAILRFLGD